MRIVILGAKGMLGSDLIAACGAAGIETAGYNRPEVDLSRDDSGLSKLPECDWVINCAAYTDVDGAETGRDRAFAVNCEGSRRMAAWCAERGIRLLYIGTDYVFDGTGNTPYKEDDRVKPLNIYAESKLAGEQAVQSVCERALIVRTQSLFGRHGRNFVQTIVSRLEESDDPLSVVDDQTSCPTYTVHLAGAILRLLETGEHGIVNVSASGSCTWYEFARAIAERVKPGAVIRPVTSGEYVRPARRPVYSVLDKGRYEEWTGHVMPTWQEGLEEYLENFEF